LVPDEDGKLRPKTVAEKCEWLNQHNTSKKVFKPTDWKNARRPERLANMLPREYLKEKLDELTSDRNS
jgi:hypothetical protein